MTIKQKLAILKYPEVNANTDDVSQFRKIIFWAEETIIQQNTDESRVQLKNFESVEWPVHFKAYLEAIECPVPVDKSEACLDWVLGCAVQIEYCKKKDIYNALATDNLKVENVPNIIADNPLDHLDYTSKEFKVGIDTLAGLLKVAPHLDPLVTLEACSKIIRNRLTTNALENPHEFIIKGTPYPYKDVDLGFDLNDPSLNEAAKVLRLLYIHDLRNLQTKANECIVSVQAITANPKTDTKLGKVGI